MVLYGFLENGPLKSAMIRQGSLKFDQVTKLRFATVRQSSRQFAKVRRGSPRFAKFLQRAPGSVRIYEVLERTTSFLRGSVGFSRRFSKNLRGSLRSDKDVEKRYQGL